MTERTALAVRLEQLQHENARLDSQNHASADSLSGGIDRVIAERDKAQAALKYAETMLVMIREMSADTKVRAVAAGAVETVREMVK